MEIFTDALLDTVNVLPFLFIVYILIETIENRTALLSSRKIMQGYAAPVVGAATGLVPQCGFSVMAAKLYDAGIIRTGTILAVFISTSDEALVVLLGDSEGAKAVLPLLAIKFAFAILVGYIANAALRRESLSEMPIERFVHARLTPKPDEGNVYTYLVSPLWQAIKIAFWLLVVNIAFGYIIQAIGEETIASSFIGGPYVQPIVTALVGLIPTCASSVIITGAYVNGGIMFGSMVAGLCCNAGLGLVVLLSNGKKIRRNIILIIVLYVTAILAGIIVNAVMVAAGWA